MVLIQNDKKKLGIGEVRAPLCPLMLDSGAQEDRLIDGNEGWMEYTGSIADLEQVYLLLPLRLR